ncbi:MAG TPA: hypothetical protein VGR28_12030 [Candidatus Thermoplasmatota archaeon]|jgi:hypothetical protein|nr:hypothetical protein [Candidatus Thermoplasmatota archaeon]
MQAPGGVVGGIPAALERMAPGDHGLVFGPASYTPLLVELLMARAAGMGFQLLLVHAGLREDEIAAQLERVPGGRDALHAGKVALLGGEGLAVLRRGLAKEGPAALAPLQVAAERLGFRGLFLCILHADGASPELEAAEAAISARLGPGLAVQCVYPSPPAARDAALRVLRAHTPGRMVMPAVWRLAERGALPSEPLAEDVEPQRNALAV